MRLEPQPLVPALPQLGSADDSHRGDRSESPARKRKWYQGRPSPEGTGTARDVHDAAAEQAEIEGAVARERLHADLAELELQLEVEREAERHLAEGVADITGLSTAEVIAPTDLQPEPAVAADVADAGPSGPLIQLNAKVDAERRASQGLLARLKAMASSLT
jgi:hypothetical protein